MAAVGERDVRFFGLHPGGRTVHYRAIKLARYTTCEV